MCSIFVGARKTMALFHCFPCLLELERQWPFLIVFYVYESLEDTDLSHISLYFEAIKLPFRAGVCLTGRM